METKPKILTVSADPRLAEEVHSAFGEAAGVRPLLSSAADHRQAVEAVRTRRPDLVLVEMEADLRRLHSFVDEVHAHSPESVVVAVFHPSLFSGDGSESSVLIEAMRVGVRDFLHRPISTADAQQLLGRLRRMATPDAPRTTGRVVAFVANKGGVGKSTLSTNVAVGLAMRHPNKVLLIDCSIQMGVCAPMLDLEPTTTITDAARQKLRLDERLLRELAVHHDKSSLDLLACPVNAVDATEVDEDVISRVLMLARRSYEYVVVDTFPMVDPVLMAILDLSESVYVLTESTVPVLRGAVRMVELLEQLGVTRSRRKLVLNRYSNFAGNLKPADVAARFKQPVDFLIPYEKKLLIAANLGVPYMLNVGRFSKFGNAMKQLIDDVERRSEAAALNPAPAAAPVRDSTEPDADFSPTAQVPA